MIRRFLFATAGLAVLMLACNASPEIPNDLPSSRTTAPQRGARGGGGEGQSDSEGEQVLTGGRAPSPSNNGNPTSADGGAGGGSTGTTDAGTTPVDSGPVSTTPPPNTACAGASTANACFQCCEQQAPGGVQKLNMFWDDCACAPTRCGAACAQSWCAGFFPNQGDACDDCLNQVAPTCDAQADAACNADATCAMLLACDQGSACASKP